MKPIHCVEDRWHGSTDTRKIVGYITREGHHIYKSSDHSHTSQSAVATCYHDCDINDLTTLALSFFMRAQDHCFNDSAPDIPFIIIGDDISLLKDPTESPL